MLHTFQDGSDSKCYINCLLETEPSKIHTTDSEAELHFPGPHPIGSPAGKRDVAFAKMLVQPATEHFLRLSKIIPNLIQLAQQYCNAPSTNSPLLYTQDTCEAFQTLLCHLLRSFESALRKLHTFRDIPPAHRDSNLFELAIYDTTVCGLTLHSFVHSSFLEEYLLRIGAPDPRTRGRNEENTQSSSLPLKISGKNSGSVSVRTAYADCLRCQTAHFEAAIDIFEINSRTHQNRVSISIATIQDTGQSMRPWRQVVEEILLPPVRNEAHIRRAQDAIAAIENIVSAHVSLSSRLNDDMMQDPIFSGALHCGACLGAVANPSASSKLSDRLAVSELCCLVCSRLLSLLQISEIPALNRSTFGHRKLIVACTLPFGLPMHIIDTMINSFSAELVAVIMRRCPPQLAPEQEGLAIQPRTQGPAPTTNMFIRLLNRLRII